MVCTVAVAIVWLRISALRTQKVPNMQNAHASNTNYPPVPLVVTKSDSCVKPYAFGFRI